MLTGRVLVLITAQDRERQHVRGEAQPLYGLAHDIESVDTVSHAADTSSGVVSITLMHETFLHGYHINFNTSTYLFNLVKLFK